MRADEAQARNYGISGVPFFLIEGKWAINGAQPIDFILSGLRQVWEQLHPAETKPTLLTAPGAEGGASCGPDGC